MKRVDALGSTKKKRKNLNRSFSNFKKGGEMKNKAEIGFLTEAEKRILASMRDKILVSPKPVGGLKFRGIKDMNLYRKHLRNPMDFPLPKSEISQVF
jgi:hypothetical protein